MDDDFILKIEDSRFKDIKCCCDPDEVKDIIACLCEFKQTIECVLDCFKDHSSCTKERIILCILLGEIRAIEDKLDNPKFGLKEIKNEIKDIEEKLDNPKFGLKEIKNEIRGIENIVAGINQNVILNDVILIDIKNEIRFIENQVTIINNTVNNNVFGLNEIKNEIRFIENQVTIINNTVNNPFFGLNEIKNEIIEINETLNNDVFGLNEIKNEIRGIENRLDGEFTGTLTTGPVFRPAGAVTLLAKALNNTGANRTVTVNLFNLDNCPKDVINTANLVLAPCCANDVEFTLSSGLQDYELQFDNVAPGIFVFTTASMGGVPELVVNTFPHSAFVPLVGNGPC